MARVDSGLFQRLADIIHEAGLRYLFTRKIHAHEKRSIRRRIELPLPELLASSLQSPHANGHNHAGFFRQRNKIAWIDKASIRMLPADQGLEPGKLPVIERNNRLVVETKLLAIESPVKIVFHLQHVNVALMHSLFEYLITFMSFTIL